MSSEIQSNAIASSCAEWTFMTTAVMAAVVLVVVLKVLVSASAVIWVGMVVEVLVINVRANVVIETLAGIMIIVVATSAIALEFAVSISYCVDVLPDMVVDALIDASAGVRIVFVLGNGVEALDNADVNVFRSLMIALEFAVPKP